MIRFLPILAFVLIGWLSWRYSVWRTMAMLNRNSTPLRDPALLAMAQRLALAAGIGRLEVRVYEVPVINGLAAPDGQIFLTRGFLDRFGAGHVSAEELAAVMAHELGHVAMGHAKRRMIDMTGQNAVFMALSLLLQRVLPIIGIWIANLLATALTARLSRRDEFEADAYATALLIRSGIGTDGQISLFHKLDRLVGVKGAPVPDWMRSHPPSAERIAAITANLDRWGGEA